MSREVEVRRISEALPQDQGMGRRISGSSLFWMGSWDASNGGGLETWSARAGYGPPNTASDPTPKGSPP